MQALAQGCTGPSFLARSACSLRSLAMVCCLTCTQSLRQPPRHHPAPVYVRPPPMSMHVCVRACVRACVCVCCVRVCACAARA